MTGFLQLVRAEWTKFRTVRSWIAAAVIAALLMVLFGWLTGAGSHSTYNNGPGTPEIVGHPPVPLGPDGEAVTDRFTFAYRTLDGDGSLTARVSDLTSNTLSPEGEVRDQETLPWSKAGLIIKASTEQGASYAAIMVTGSHGVRFQHDFTGDIAGPADARWLRLTREGQTITGYASTDGAAWTKIGSARLANLPESAPAGLFTTAPAKQNVTQKMGGGGSITGGRGVVTATFDSIAAAGAWSAGDWRAGAVGSPLQVGTPVVTRGDTVVVTGSGDIAPAVDGPGVPVERVLAGAFAALTVAAVFGALFMTSEYRRGMVRTTLAASPGRVRVLAAKAVVVGGVTFAAGLVGSAAALWFGARLLRTNGNFIYPYAGATELRLVAGTAAVIAVAAVLALAVGTILRRSAGAIAAVVVLVVLPYILASAAVLPAEPSRWLLRITPAAGFAIQQSLPEYAQVDAPYTPAFGFFPLAPWVGFGVLCAWAAVALGVAGWLLRRRDV